MANHTADAEALFRAFAQRHSLSIQKIDDPDFELLMVVPSQTGLSFELTLGLQNDDELNIGFEQFWSYFFPFEKMRETVSDTLDALVTGECRLAVHSQLGRVVKQVLERRSNGRWKRVYTDCRRFQIPFLGTRVSHLFNENPRPACSDSL